MSLITHATRFRGRGTGSANSDFPNRPSNYATVSPTGDTTISGISNTPPNDTPGWGFSGNYSLATDATGPYLGTSLGMLVPSGTADGGGCDFGQNYLPSPMSAQYYCVVFKLSSAFVQHTVGYKFIYPEHYTTNTSTRRRCFMFGFEAVGATNSGQFKWAMLPQLVVDTPAPTTLHDNVTTATLNNDTWYRLELLTVTNTPGVANGTADWWTSAWNGSSWNTPVHNAAYTNVQYSDSIDDGRWVKADIDLYAGGSGGTPIPADQYVYVNRVNLSVPA